LNFSNCVAFSIFTASTQLTGVIEEFSTPAVATRRLRHCEPRPR
jgi:hypothetical protein